MKMNAFRFYNNKTGKWIEMYAKLSDVRTREIYDVFGGDKRDLSVFDGGYVEVSE